MAEKSVSDEVALNCERVLRYLDDLVEAADEAFDSVTAETANQLEMHIRLMFHNVRVGALHWKEQCKFPQSVLDQAKEVIDHEF